MDIIRNKKSLQELIARLRSENKNIAAKTSRKIALVPTMGALHAGHMALVKAAQAHADYVVVSIFVNPTQFGPNEDFARYPRVETQDIMLLKAHDVDIVYLPTVSDMYIPGFATSIIVNGITEALDGAFRPGHFAGMATVVAKLLLQVQPDIALFGEKDYQQLQVIKRMVTDLDIPINILAVPTARDADGLALSSRNAYLSHTEKVVAPELYRILLNVKQSMRNGKKPGPILMDAIQALEAKGFGPVQYLELRDAETLAPITHYHKDKATRLFAAAYLGKTRLIDNISV